jgi:hypothetical protein
MARQNAEQALHAGGDDLVHVFRVDQPFRRDYIESEFSHIYQLKYQAPNSKY